MLEAVLFDLDGTLADTAPDLCGAANFLLMEAGRPPADFHRLRPYVSQGVRGLLHAAFGLTPEDVDYAPLAERFLARYAAHLCVESRLFDGVPALLTDIEQRQMAWGIVTNKRMRFTDPLVAQLDLSPRTTCVVSGDTTSEAKPSARPVLHACSLLGVAPARTLFVGDDRRDIEAGRAAGCTTVAVRYGYLGDCGPIESWGADLIIDHPEALIAYLSTQAIPPTAR